MQQTSSGPADVLHGRGTTASASSVTVRLFAGTNAWRKAQAMAHHSAPANCFFLSSLQQLWTSHESAVLCLICCADCAIDCAVGRCQRIFLLKSCFLAMQAGWLCGQAGVGVLSCFVNSQGPHQLCSTCASIPVMLY